MGKINASDFGSSRPKLTQEDIEEGDYTLLTIATVDTVSVSDDEKESGERKSLVLTFKETGDKALWLNVTMIKSLIAEIGDDTDKWPGEQVPVEKYTGKFMNKEFEKVGIMASADWPAAFKEAGVRRKKATTPPASNAEARRRSGAKR